MKLLDVKQRLNSLVNRVQRRETRMLVEKAGIPVTPRQVDAARLLIEREAAVVVASEAVSGVVRHAEDDSILSAAVSASINLLISGDIRLQRIGTHHGVTIPAPANFSKS